jgi:3-hydroxyacyl-CoA dehydrogenase/enoyl-CoA hydratase/3-hydroxybutyryl-CoA epimerase
MGIKDFVVLCDRLAIKYGPRFTPPELLREMAAHNQTFYPETISVFAA